MVARVDLAADWVHDDTACVRMMTESGIMLWRDQLVGVISSKSLGECHARNLRPETCRWWLSGCLRKHLFFVRPQHWLKVAKSTHLLQRVFERPCRGILDGDRHLFLAFYGFKRHDEHVSQQDLLEILASFASSGQPVQGGITGEPFPHM